MPDGMLKNPQTVDSTAPVEPWFKFAPVNFRQIMQRQMQFTADRSVDQAVSFTFGGEDGRFLSNSPGQTLLRENDDGNQFHMVGVNRGGDLSVAGP